MDKAEIVSKLKALIEEEAQLSISSNDEELDIDSFTMMLVITYVKEEFFYCFRIITFIFKKRLDFTFF